MDTETDWQPTVEQDRAAAEWHETQDYLAWCERVGLVPNEATELAYAEMQVEDAEARAEARAKSAHTGCVHSVGYCSDRDED